MISISTQGNIEHERASSPWLEDWDTCRCGKASVSMAQESGSGQTDGDILLHFEKSTDNWRMRILFNQVVYNLRDTAGRKAGCDKKACVLESKGNEERGKKGSNSLLKIKLIAVVKEPKSLAIDKLDLCCDKPKTAATRIQQSSTHATNSDDGFPWATSSYTDPAVGALGATASYIHTGDRVRSSPGATLSYSNGADPSGSSLLATSSYSHTGDRTGGSPGATLSYSNNGADPSGSSLLATSSYSHTGDRTGGSPGATLSYSNGAYPSGSSLGATSSHSVTTDSVGGSLGATSPYSHVGDRIGGSPGAALSYSNVAGPSASALGATSSQRVTTNSVGGTLGATAPYSLTNDPAVWSPWVSSSYSHTTEQTVGSPVVTLSDSNTIDASRGALRETLSDGHTTHPNGGSPLATSFISHATDQAVGSPRVMSYINDPIAGSTGTISSHSLKADKIVGSSVAISSDSSTTDPTGGALRATLSNGHPADSNRGSPLATSFISHATDQAVGSPGTPGTMLYTHAPTAGFIGSISAHSLMADHTRDSHRVTSPYGHSIDPRGGSRRAKSSSDYPRITTASVIATDTWPPNDLMKATNYYLRVNKIPIAKEKRLFKKAETPSAAGELPSKQNGLPTLKTLRHRIERKVSRRRKHMMESPLYPSPDSNYPLFTKVFGFPIFGVAEFTDEYFQHVASVVAELLDNDQDGCVDTPEVVEAMIKSKYALACLVKRQPSDKPGLIGPYKIGLSLLKRETMLNCFPKSRISFRSEVCFDQTYQETFNLVFKFGYAIAFPRIFGNNFNKLSKLNKAMDKARGGRFYKVPELYPSSAWFTYYDPTCTYSCQVNQYICWGIASYSNAIARQTFMKKEWKFSNRDQLRKGDVLLSEIIKDTRTYRLPIRRPTGNYFGSNECLIHGQDGPVSGDEG
eukprot:Seg2189.7 transcript_id=Seg2189.7/GoldUCD/mRNA.D3Y31 product="hypothetical protein" protein_id=Seg2189.7/GoldUCD/D3Y31